MQEILNQETTLVMIKGDGHARRLVGTIIMEIEKMALNLAGIKMLRLSSEQLDTLYQEHKERFFYPRLRAYMQMGPVTLLAVSGENVVAKLLEVKGKNPLAEREQQTLRGKYGINMAVDTIHCSDSVPDGQKEVGLFFRPDELCYNNPEADDYVSTVKEIDDKHQLVGKQRGDYNPLEAPPQNVPGGEAEALIENLLGQFLLSGRTPSPQKSQADISNAVEKSL